MVESFARANVSVAGYGARLVREFIIMIVSVRGDPSGPRCPGGTGAHGAHGAGWQAAPVLHALPKLIENTFTFLGKRRRAGIA